MNLTLLLLLPLLGAPAYGQEPTGCVKPRDACVFFDRYLSAFNRRDWAAFTATFDDEITVMFDRPAPPERRDGRAAVEEFFRRVFPAPGQVPTQLPAPILPVNLLAQDFGKVVVISFHMSGSEDMARRTLVLHRTSRGWRVVHIHASSVVQAP